MQASASRICVPASFSGQELGQRAATGKAAHTDHQRLINGAPRLAIGFALAAGLTLVFAGALVLLPERLSVLRLPAPAGPRSARRSAKTAGRVFFGLFALGFDIAAIGLWLRLIRGPRSQ